MKKLKEFLSNPKKTAILGLVGGIIMLLFKIIYTIYCIYFLYIDRYTDIYSLIYDLFSTLFILGIITYFVVVLLRMSKHNVNINIANNILITTFIVSFIGIIYVGISVGEGIDLSAWVLFISALYFANILLRKIKLINNKVFAIVVIACLMCESIMNVLNILKSSELYFPTVIYFITSFIKHIGYIAILPYFYNYYKLLKKEEK